MEAVVFRIREAESGQTVYQDIVGDTESTIFPGVYIYDENGNYIEGMPYECELHKFIHCEKLGYVLETHTIELSWEQAMQFKR